VIQIIIEESTSPPPPDIGLASPHDPPQYECPPPSYEDYIKDIPPPPYPEPT